MAHKANQFLREKTLFLQLGKVDFMTKSFHWVLHKFHIQLFDHKYLDEKNMSDLC